MSEALRVISWGRHDRRIGLARALFAESGVDPGNEVVFAPKDQGRVTKLGGGAAQRQFVVMSCWSVVRRLVRNVTKLVRLIVIF